MIYRVYVEKKPEYAVEAAGVLADIKTVLQIKGVDSLRVLNRYDLENIAEEEFVNAKQNVLSEPQLDFLYDHIPEEKDRVFAVEFLPGQFDQRASSAAQCIQILNGGELPLVRCARVYLLSGKITDEEFEQIKSYVINPVEAREALLSRPKTLKTDYEIPTTVDILSGFCELSEDGLSEFLCSHGLAMDLADLIFCQEYFRDTEKRDPTITEIRVIDTYWSDHCRHTTFLTRIEEANIEPPYIKKTYEKYRALRESLYAGKNKPVTLMDIATIAGKALKKEGVLNDLDESEEINACSVRIKADVSGEAKDYLLMFKNETHNHPTEIEPFGGAATCLGGAIRDPLSGRSYVFGAMRVTGAADPTGKVSDTLKGKLPQRKLTTTAAAGYSSYGNQIGLATGHVSELYHPGYSAKRLEIGAVLGAAPIENVRRASPEAGDVVILLGGKTGRDGCGGATGSSKSHTLESLETCGAEVQKGNPPEERKIQRLFRKGEVTRMIKRCNDFGAGGVSVAIGELSDSLLIDLDKVPKKYEGLDGTEIAISESQERMAVVVAKEDEKAFIAEADKENLDACTVAEVRDDGYLRMVWNKNPIVTLSRDFLNSNGAPKYTDVSVKTPKPFCKDIREASLKEKLLAIVSDLNFCSQKGLVERFDSTIGAGTVLMPFGGERELTPAQALALKLPIENGETTTVSVMAWGFDPYISEQSPYHGAIDAVVSSVAKLIASGGSQKNAHLTLQEYFPRVGEDETRWGMPFAALLGALEAQLSLKVAAIGGKDSMSGSFEKLDVPPTLVSFAVGISDIDNITSPELKEPGDVLYLLTPNKTNDHLPDFDSVNECFAEMERLIAQNKAKAVYVPGRGGVLEAVFKMAVGNNLGVELLQNYDREIPSGSFLFEGEEGLDTKAVVIGRVLPEPMIREKSETISLSELLTPYEEKLKKVFPYLSEGERPAREYEFSAPTIIKPRERLSKVNVLIPVFPGTNCEYDTARAFFLAGANPITYVIKNRSALEIKTAVSEFSELIKVSQIIAIPGGFSGGDEPEGSAKFITSFFRNERIKDGVHELLKNRDGLMIGICNGFQALVKLGLVPYGEIMDTDENCPTLTFNEIGRHQSMLVRTRISSNLSPWFSSYKSGDVHLVPISHGEGRFVAREEVLAKMAANGQIATQYVDLQGTVTMDMRYNPNGSIDGIEGITSPDGRVLGKMAHSERFGNGLYKNVSGTPQNTIFENAVAYFKL